MPDTLGLPGKVIAAFLISIDSRGRFAQLASPHGEADVAAHAAAEWEYAARSDVFAIADRPSQALVGKRVLDIGSGYGGRPVAYAELGADVVGLEPYAPAVEAARRFAASRDSDAQFVEGWGEHLPFPDASFDIAICFDVLEHVQDPASVIAEISRVVMPGGEAWLIFPSYLGARASHLDYVTRVPGLHRLFRPDVLAAAANDVASRRGLGTQVAPSQGPFRRWTIMGTLNGMSRSDAQVLLADAPFDWSVRSEPIIEPRSRLPLGPRLSSALARLGPMLPELLVGRIVAIGTRLPG